MSDLINNVGREIRKVERDYCESMHDDYGKIILQHEKITGSEAMVDAFFAVKYGEDGLEIRRIWLGQGVSIFWK